MPDMESGTNGNALNTTGRSPRRRRLVWAFVMPFGLALLAGMYRYLTLCCAPDIAILRGGQSTGLDRLGSIGPIGVPDFVIPVPPARISPIFQHKKKTIVSISAFTASR